ncbi:MAG: hypothetical protein ACRDZ8_17420 [Acidimicrobiales bacterium]
MGRYPLIPELSGRAVTVGEYIDLQVPLLIEAVDAHRMGGDPPLVERIWHGLGLKRRQDLAPEEAWHILAANHGYADPAAAWDPVDPDFEAAADAVQWGDLGSLRRLLDDHPVLVHARSPFVHHATLLHLVAANGVEVERQLQSPVNAVEVARLLLDRGAEPDALCDTYGGGLGQTPLYLLVSSCVPAEAGVQAALVEALCAGGAAVDGVDGDSWPLWTAIAFGYREAAAALARSGARVDNLVLAAALGDLDGTQAWAATEGARARLRLGSSGPHIPAGHQLDYALIWAALHDRREVVTWLLGQDLDLTVRDPFFHSTALGAARYAGNDHVVTMLEAATATAGS